ncbi:hemin uptake protein HemP [Melaminivora suipulveris]|uniref:Hemin uptake protein HemP n=1 Tax=Melaminivora suipulveris TaxID=2109913 RepID=A0A2R3QF88_9BURK|nr:hemin uptake protein HemP [Melaminivora suipulveris]AVO50429.1 hemin uptake protein HemP [Melaminivora suipulveris]
MPACTATQPLASASATPRHAAAPATADPLAVDSAALLRGHKAVTIVHKGTLYRLQATRQGKLILTK